MEPVTQHSLQPDARFDGGDLDCGNGLLLLLRKNLDALMAGQLLEVCSVEPSVEQDLPAWCRLTSNELVSWTKTGKQRSFLIRKGLLPAVAGNEQTKASVLPVFDAVRLEMPIAEPRPGKLAIEPLSVMGIGSWPRPRWLVRDLHEYVEGRMQEADFLEAANDSVRLVVAKQLEAGVDVITDGEQRRDNYSSFVGMRLVNCQLIPLVDLLPLVDDAESFSLKLKALDVPADKVRHPAVSGKIWRKSPLALQELQFLQTLSSSPTKVALPGPYLLSRTMWMECISDKAYSTREDLAADIVSVLREELADLLNAGAAIVQFDEPVLTEVVHGKASTGSTFMCGALSKKEAPAKELAFARDLINAVVAGFPRDRIAMHVCRGNWTPDESAALAGDYLPLIKLFAEVAVGTLFLEFCTERAGSLSVLSSLPDDLRIGLGVVNPKNQRIETPEEVCQKVLDATKFVDRERLLLNPDCGFATFADNPVSSGELAMAKLSTMVIASQILRG